MDIESELPDEFDEFSDEKKVEALEELKNRFEEEEQSPVKVRMIEELKRTYED
ncbi:hypothetical protein GKQ38_02915 [Candidatus Nanohaloarchaea archaeon]|nr:hypothetical protein GKQ38_02915 [Candidatus Nanohaloarchaea archaeon]